MADEPRYPRNSARDDVVASGLEATLARDDAAPKHPAANVELEPTLASGAPDSSSSASPPRVMGGDDYQELATVDPQRYAVDREIARGGMGRIMAARDRRLGRPVAIKELLVDSDALRTRFEREARITAKLQHPAIVSLLEAGTWPGGEPFYVMKLVTGESLDKVIAQRPTLAARLGLLPNVIAAVDALAYAHTMRVIHRDLKPANVLVGEFGETVVIDWGLAKDLADTSGSPDVTVGPVRRTPAAPDETVAGSVMGTPAYMPVEQASGDAVDERADVYALGAMLYHVLAGVPPYTGKTADAILDAVIAGPPTALDACTPGVPPDLVTIVNKAMAHAAADRYPTAKELADDLKKFQTGQLVGAHHYSRWQLLRRWIDRHRTPIAISAVATVMLGVLGVVSIRRIVREQARTEQSRRNAEDLMTFMLGSLSHKLEALGRLDLLDDVAKKAVAYYDAQKGDLNDPDLAARAIALRSLGEVLAAQGHTDEALRQYRAALAISKTLAASDSTNDEWQGDVAASHERIGVMLLMQGHATEAIAEHRAELAIAEARAAADPTRAWLQRNLSMGHNRIGDALLARGDAAAALVEYRASSEIAKAVVARDPANSEAQRDLAVSHQAIADVLGSHGDTTGALAEYRAALAIVQTLLAKDPTNAEWQRDLSLGHDGVGAMLNRQGDVQGALVEYRAAMVIKEALAANDTTNAGRQRDLSLARSNIGDALRVLGDATGALAEYRASLLIDKTLVAIDPMNADRQRDLSISHDRVGVVLNQQGDVEGALAEYRASMTIRDMLVAKDPKNAERQRESSVSHNRVGDALRARGDTAGALAEFRTAMATRKLLAASDPTNAERQRDLSVSLDNVGGVLRAQGDTAAALAEYRTSLAIAETLAAHDPTNADGQLDLSLSHANVGDALLALGKATDALGEYQASIAIAENQAAKEPKNALWQQDLSEGHGKLGDVQIAQGDKAGALAEYKAALAIAQRLETSDPTNAEIRSLRTTLSTKLAAAAKQSPQ